MATVSGKAILITGGNRGIGHALTVEALKRGARRVYVGTRKALADKGDSRVTPLTLDITDGAHLEAAAAQVDPPPRHTEGRAGIRGARHLRRGAERR